MPWSPRERRGEGTKCTTNFQFRFLRYLYKIISMYFKNFLKISGKLLPIFFWKTCINTRFFPSFLLQLVYCSNFECFSSTLLKLFLKFFHIFSKFIKFSLNFSAIRNFSKTILLFPHNFP